MASESGTRRACSGHRDRQPAEALVKLRDDLKLSDCRYNTLTKMYNEKPEALMIAHSKLDAAVFAAYGWQVDLSGDETLCVGQLLALNLSRAGELLSRRVPVIVRFVGAVTSLPFIATSSTGKRAITLSSSPLAARTRTSRWERPAPEKT